MIEDLRKTDKLLNPKSFKPDKKGPWRKVHMKHFKMEKKQRTQSKRGYFKLLVENGDKNNDDEIDWSYDKFSTSRFLRSRKCC